MSSLPRPPGARQTDAERLAGLTEAIRPQLPPGVAALVMPRPADSAADAEVKWQRAVTEGLAEVQRRAAANGGPQVTHVQDTPSAVWTIPHNMGGFPAVAVVDSTGRVGFGNVIHESSMQLRVEFSAGFSGRAYLVL